MQVNWNSVMTTGTVNQPIGEIVLPLPSGKAPDLSEIQGKTMRLEALNAEQHGVQLFESFANSPQAETMWHYMPYGPFADYKSFESYVVEKAKLRDPWFYALVRQSDSQSMGVASFMRHDAANGAIEIGNIWFAPELQKSREATEAIYLMLRYGFEVLGVRRLEWKCDSLNAPSRKAALRFGFHFEGIFRQHYIIKGRNRDTAWFSIIDKDWPRLKRGFDLWLAEENFDSAAREKVKLQACLASAN